MTIESTEGTRADVRRARRASFGAAFSYGSVLSATVLGLPAPPVVPEVLEELQIRARLEQGAYEELRRRSRRR